MNDFGLVSGKVLMCFWSRVRVSFGILSDYYKGEIWCGFGLVKGWVSFGCEFGLVYRSVLMLYSVFLD